jgi:outer membrane immunogenic protein
MQKRITAVAVTAIILAAPAMAGGKQAGGDDWSGAYVGFNLGGSQLKADTTRTITDGTYFSPADGDLVEAASLMDIDGTNFTAGFLAGYNWGLGWGVIGVETDFAFNSVELSDAALGAYPSDPTLNFIVDTQVDQDWTASLRAKFGVEAAGSLIYATGGVAIADVSFLQTFQDTNAVPFQGLIKEETRAGWTAGGGIEVPVFSSTTIKVEYLYTDLGSMKLPQTFFVGAPDAATSGKADITNDVLRAGMNWKLN